MFQPNFYYNTADYNPHKIEQTSLNAKKKKNTFTIATLF